MRDWGLLYQRPPMHTDALLLAVALALHVPLFTLHMMAPHKGAKAIKEGRLHDIDFLEKQVEKKKEKEDARAAQEEARRRKQEDAARVREMLLKKAVPLPPVVPKPDVHQKLADAPDASKIKMDLKQQLELQNQKLLEGKKTFLGKDAPLAGVSGPKEIKMGGGVTAIRMGASAGALPGAPGGPALKGRSGFTVSDRSMPMSIGGGDEGIKTGGGPAIVVHTGARSRVDAGVLSSVAMVKDKGSLQGKGAGGAGSGLPGGGGSSDLALGPGGGKAIAVSGASRGPAMDLPAAPVLGGGKSFSDKAVAAAAAPPAEGGMRAAGAGLPDVGAIARRARTARPMFQITGPLSKRPVVSRVLPEYPEWARAKGIEAAVTLQFTVSPEGVVKDTIIVLRTSGFPALDETARDALRQWVFSALPPDELRDEVGAITMNFSVR